MFYVYKLIDPRDTLPFYIGKGKSQRWRVHFTPSSKGQNPYKDAVIRNIQACGLDVIVEHIKCDSEEDALQLEQALISELGRRDINTGILTNLQNGGEGAGSGRVLSHSTRTKLSEWRQRHPYNRCVPPCGNAVVQLSFEGTVVSSFSSALAAQRATSVDATMIGRCCTGMYKTAGGFRWQYADPDQVVHRSKKLTKPVRQLTLDGEVVTIHPSIGAAARAMNTGTSYIARTAKDNGTAFGYRWSLD